MVEPQLGPPGTYRPQYTFRRRGFVRVLNRFPRFKAWLADVVRGALGRVFAPGMVTTERVVEYPFVFQNLDGVTGPILDIGCCGSGLPISLASRGFRVFGLDFNPYPFRHPNFRAIRGDAMRCPFRTGGFGAVLAISVIEHLGVGHYGDPAAAAGDRIAVREIARLLRPAGLAVITVPFGVARTDDFQRVYDPPRLAALLAPFSVIRIEYAWSREGLWMPCTEAEAAMVDWAGPNRAVALVVATVPGG